MKHCSGLALAFVVLLCSGMFVAADTATGPQVVLQADSDAPLSAAALEKKPDQPESYDANYTYDSGGRRDPFSSLIGGVRGTKGSTVPKGALTVTDAKVVGITQSSGGFVAIVMGSDRKARFMRVGDKLYDGEIIGIEQDKVIFRQDITEEIGMAPGLKSKEVVKRLHPVTEGT